MLEALEAIFSEKQAAKEIGVQPVTLTKWRYLGRGPKFLRLHGKIRYRKADLEAYVESCVVDPRDRVRKKSQRTHRGSR
jgi:hypothetical protein